MKIIVGPRGGSYYIKRGRKIYLSSKRKRRSNKRTRKKRRKSRLKSRSLRRSRFGDMFEKKDLPTKIKEYLIKKEKGDGITRLTHKIFGYIHSDVNRLLKHNMVTTVTNNSKDGLYFAYFYDTNINNFVIFDGFDGKYYYFQNYEYFIDKIFEFSQKDGEHQSDFKINNFSVAISDFVKKHRGYVSKYEDELEEPSEKPTTNEFGFMFGADDDVSELEKRLESSLGVELLSDYISLENVKRVFQPNGEFKEGSKNKYHNIFKKFCKNIIDDNNIILSDVEINEIANKVYNNAKSYINNENVFKENVESVLNEISKKNFHDTI